MGSNMQRREFISAAAMVTAGLTINAARAASDATAKPKTTESLLILQKPEVVTGLPKFAEEAAICSLKGSLCVQHCEELMAKGNREFSSCSLASSQMALICSMVSKLAAMKSVRLAETLDACSAACKACKEACEEHKAHWAHGMHLVCKTCAEHCDRMISEVAKLKNSLSKA
jgi:Cys-rich four helix bundle protein (predicted Tat secretion target)